MTTKLAGKLDYSKTTIDALAKWAQQGEPKRTAAHANRARGTARGVGRGDEHSLAWCGPRRWAGIAQARVVRFPATNVASARCG